MVRQQSRGRVAWLVLVALVSVASTASATHRFVQQVLATEAQEVPAPPQPNGGTATGFVAVNTVTNTISYDIVCNGLNGTVSAAHIHGYAQPGASAGVRFGLTANGPTRFTGSFVYPDTAEANLLSGATYVNVHTTLNPAGQVRDQLNRYVASSEDLLPGLTPYGVALVAFGLAGGAVLVLRRRRSIA